MNDLTGKRFCKLVVLKQCGTKSGKRMWECICDCGNKSVVSTNQLTSGHTKSCGCLVGRPGGKSPGWKGTAVYSRWQAMKKRCYQVGTAGYENYGGRGIKVCDEWKDNPSAFCEWALANGFSEELTLDRIDVNGDYSPENCRWATKTEQARNKRNNRIVEYNGKKMTEAEYSEITGVKHGSIDWRLNRSKMSESDAVNRPIRTQKKGIELGFDLSEECRKRGLKLSTVWARINKLGWSVEDALTVKKNGLYAKKPNKNA